MSKVVLVTGGARGIGLGIVHAFAAAGHQVMIGDLGAGASDWNYDLSDANDLDKALARESSVGEVDACELNVTKLESCERAVAATLERFGRLDVLVNNAGIVDTGPISEFEEEDWDRIFAVNTKGIFLMSKAALEALKASGQGAIVNTASIAGKQGNANMSAYCGSKFAAIGITQSLALELAPHNITVNALCPGIVGTAMWLEHLIPSNTTELSEKERNFEDSVNSMIPLGRPQTTEDMGQAALYLATARNVSGIALTVAGGMTMN
ncbi:MAG: SDR family oxidoreductase [Pseudomonadales bacterium]|nr:SDR family oxidoreductase [Pseudomonadales bacterium]MBO6657595.1 SDR family oxidoreductase [Pseudomonadales bacterium]MBO6703220.1 SDR family oxidoreductase [Pseudomonadales bacterium]MBO7006224.1 SDR family oxidoreductase [Pseudomonadales bacterium]